MRVLVVDDSTLFRKIVRDAIDAEPDVEVVGTASNGRLALEKIEQLRPDVVTLDLEMPEMDGLEVLRRLQGSAAPPRVIMVSSFTSQGAALTAQALRLGAFDFILKPATENLDDNRNALRAQIRPKLQVIAATAQQMAAAKSRASDEQCPLPPRPTAAMGGSKAMPEIIAIGVSTGGPAALAALLSKLPADVPAPVVIVQHMPPVFTRSLADDLNGTCKLQVSEAVDGEPLMAGHVYIAPGGRQMKIAQGFAGPEICITDDPPEKNCRPSVDYLFRSLAHLYGNRVLAMILTGMGDDGTLGCRLLKRQGATILAQDEASCVVYGMPRQIVDLGLADEVLPLGSMSQAIVDRVRKEPLPCR
jgi:two-component system chemotaxis response regulator CheB